MQLKFLFLLLDKLLVRNIFHKGKQKYDNNLISVETYKTNKPHVQFDAARLLKLLSLLPTFHFWVRMGQYTNQKWNKWSHDSYWGKAHQTNIACHP